MKRYGRTEKRRKRNDPFDRFVFVCTKRNAKFILAPTVYIYIYIYIYIYTIIFVPYQVSLYQMYLSTVSSIVNLKNHTCGFVQAYVFVCVYTAYVSWANSIFLNYGT